MFSTAMLQLENGLLILKKKFSDFFGFFKKMLIINSNLSVFLRNFSLLPVVFHHQHQTMLKFQMYW